MMNLNTLPPDQIDKLSKAELDKLILDLKDIKPTDPLSDEEMTYICRIMAAARRQASGPPKQKKDPPKNLSLDDLADSLFT